MRTSDDWKSRLPALGVTAEEMAAAATPRGQWTAKTLAGWGVSWPPPAGWRQELLRRAKERPQSSKSGPPASSIEIRVAKGVTALVRLAPILDGLPGLEDVVREIVTGESVSVAVRLQEPFSPEEPPRLSRVIEDRDDPPWDP